MMPEPVKAHLGRIEVPARDPARAAEFFRRVFGWRAEPVDWEGPAYVELRTPGAEGAAPIGAALLAAAAAGFDRPLPVLHLSEGTLEDCLARVEAAGGTIAQAPRRVGDFGRFARFRDPDGHQWGLWTG